jgi:hypothetical protein
MCHRDRLAEGQLLALHFRRLCLEKKSHDACCRGDAQPPDVALDQPPPQTSAKESPGDVVDQAEHLGPSDLEDRSPSSPTSAAVQVRGNNRQRPSDNTGRGETAFLVADRLLRGASKGAESRLDLSDRYPIALGGGEGSGLQPGEEVTHCHLLKPLASGTGRGSAALPRRRDRSFRARPRQWRDRARTPRCG